MTSTGAYMYAQYTQLDDRLGLAEKGKRGVEKKGTKD